MSFFLFLPYLDLSQVSVSLMESGNLPENNDDLIELVSSSETGFIHLFSQQQLQVSVYFHLLCGNKGSYWSFLLSNFCPICQSSGTLVLVVLLCPEGI